MRSTGEKYFSCKLRRGYDMKYLLTAIGLSPGGSTKENIGELQ